MRAVLEARRGRVDQATAATRPAARTAEGLSERELEVLVASGASNQDAVRKLFIAASTRERAS